MGSVGDWLVGGQRLFMSHSHWMPVSDMTDGARKKVIDEVLAKIRPLPEEERAIVALAEEVMAKCGEEGRRLGATFQPVLVGSVSKGTANKGADIDVFLRFPLDVPLEKMEKVALAVGKAVIPDGRCWYAQHPYVKGMYKGSEVEIVPCFDVVPDGDGLKKMSPVDRTPHHTRYIMEHLPVALRDDVRLFKQFLKGIGVYGAEIRIQGFAGYLVELVVMRYGGFEKTLEAIATQWRRGTRLAMDDVQIGRAPVFDSALTFIDPVDVTRNVASALSEHNMMLLIEASGDFLKDPTPRYFFPTPFRQMTKQELETALARINGMMMGVDIPVPDMVDDIIYSQLQKAEKAIAKKCGEHGFLVLRSDFDVREEGAGGRWRRALFILEFESMRLHPDKLHLGPAVGKGNEAAFRDKWSAHKDMVVPPFIKDDRWQVVVRRTYIDVSELLLKEVQELNLGKNLNEELGKGGFKVLNVGELVEKHGNELSMFFDTRRPWKR